MSKVDEDLFYDPMPQIRRDTRFWPKLFREIYSLDIQNRLVLHKLLWRMRSMGTYIRITHVDIKLEPLFHPEGYWEDQEQYDEIKQILKPFGPEIRQLLNRVNQEERIA
ncbi:hypothetical protein [Paenibacillus alba]|uniref:Uncharacterized protein n=1 Tax=Paenibacillus alba TaxID=1197127 RepID=A0ABU6GDK1_9BACL|nr:hypothetical protein [Paenibacillus alba]MEC0231312.1 hypothetical protein [Paenibacillus alba]